VGEVRTAVKAVKAVNTVNDARKVQNVVKGTGKVDISEPYKRPSGSVTNAQRASVQGKPCVTCGNNDGGKRIADHKDPLVKEYYETGKIDKAKMRDVNSVQPQCTRCSAQQGAIMAKYSKEKKIEHGFTTQKKKK